MKQSLIFKSKIVLLRLCKVFSRRTAQEINSISLPELPFTILMTGYNNSKYLVQSVESALQQHYTNFHIMYIDDCSTDHASQLLKHYENNPLITVICNKERVGKLANLYKIIHTIGDNNIIVELDADDYLKDQWVLKRFNALFQQTKCLIAHAHYINSPEELARNQKLTTFSQATPWFIKKTRSFRTFPWIYSGLRCYYAHLFKKIKKEDLQYNNTFFMFFHDAAMVYPMLEMAGDKIGYIQESLLIRNIDSPINDFKKLPDDIKKIQQKVRQTHKYEVYR